MIEGDIAILVVLIDQHGMALRKGAALGVLPGEAHRVALHQEGAEGERLAGRPVDAVAAVDRLAAILQEALDGAMGAEALRDDADLAADLPQQVERRPGMAAARVVGIARRLDIGPAAVEPVGAVRPVALARLELAIEAGAPFACACSRPRQR